MIPTTVDNMRAELLKLGEPEDIVASMKKNDLKTKLLELYNKRTDEDMSFSMEKLEEDNSQTLEGAVGVKYASPEWSNYVMGLFQPDELMDGYPKVNGLRRVANLVLGDIIFSGPVNTLISHGEVKSIVVNYEIHVEWKLNIPVGFGNLGFTPQVRKFGALADCQENSSTMFGRHPAATADSKSESRALRKALALNVIAAEEVLTGAADEMPSTKGAAKITSALRSVIVAKCSSLKINLIEILSDRGYKPNIEDLTMEEGRDLFTYINSFQQR